jgi:hypothetical protein
MQSEEAKQGDDGPRERPPLQSLWAHIVETHAAKPQDQRLVYPLTSRKVLTWEAHDLGNTTETQLTVESVGRNGVKRVVDALLRLTTTDRAVERILTIHTQSRWVTTKTGFPRLRFCRPSS